MITLMLSSDVGFNTDYLEDNIGAIIYGWSYYLPYEICRPTVTSGLLSSSGAPTVYIWYYHHLEYLQLPSDVLSSSGVPTVPSSDLLLSPGLPTVTIWPVVITWLTYSYHLTCCYHLAYLQLPSDLLSSPGLPQLPSDLLLSPGLPQLPSDLLLLPGLPTVIIWPIVITWRTYSYHLTYCCHLPTVTIWPIVITWPTYSYHLTYRYHLAYLQLPTDLLLS